MKLEKIEEDFGSIMVIVPHQDDEILMTAGILYTAVKKKLPVSVVMVTNGDCGCKDYSVGRQRLEETIRGTQMLGIKPEQVIFAGYADTGMPQEDSFLAHLYQEKDENRLYPSLCSKQTYGLAGKEDYHFTKTGAHAPYTRKSLKGDLRNIIREGKPDHIFTTSAFDMHGDHKALYQFVVEILEECKQENGYTPTLYTGMVHSNAGDDCWPQRESVGTVYECPKDFDAMTGLKWNERVVFPVPQEMSCSLKEKNLKYKALLEYKTALEPSAYDFLMAFMKEEEVFWR